MLYVQQKDIEQYAGPTAESPEWLIDSHANWSARDRPRRLHYAVGAELGRMGGGIFRLPGARGNCRPDGQCSGAGFRLAGDEQVNAKLAVCAPNTSGILVLCFATILGDDSHRQMGNILQRHSSAPLAAVAVEPQDPLEIIFTSGTTAEPKGVVITHGNVLTNVTPLEKEIRKYLKYERYFILYAF